MADQSTETHIAEELTYDEFPIPDLDVWIQAVAESTGGKPLEKLVTPSYEGIDIRPMATADDTKDLDFARTLPGRPPFLRGATAAGYLARPWAVAQELALPTPTLFNQALLDDLAHGQTAINILLDAPTRAGRDPDQAQPGEVGRGGLSLATTSDVTVTLGGVDLAETPISIRAGTVALSLLALLIAHVRRQGRTSADLHGWLEDDPLGVIAHEGSLPLSIPRALDEMAHLTRWAAIHAPRLGTIAVHTYPYHDAGANAVQELAAALSTAVFYLRQLSDRGVPVETAAPRIRFDFAIGPQFFMEIAKLRAARMLWAQVVYAFGGDEAAQRMNIHARTGRYHKTLTDAHVNMLRVTTEALAAALGGVDSLHMSPYDEPAGPADAFSRRIARNVQIILQDEVHLTQLVDPAGGTWAVEVLVNDLAHKAWALFQTLEAQGGMWAALQSGFVQREVATVRAKRNANLATRKDVLVGTNQFAIPTDQPLPPDATHYEAIYRERAAQLAHYRSHDDDPSAHVAALQRLGGMLDASPEQMVESAIAAALMGATLNEITRALRVNDRDRPIITPLPQNRVAEPFEALRADAAEWGAVHGHPPRIFLANIGPLRQLKARADFAQGFFEPGGFSIISPPGFTSWEEAIAAAAAAEAQAVVICSTDETYPELVPPLARALKSALAETAVLVAGRPGELEADYRRIGVDAFIFIGADCLAINRWLLDRIRTGEPA